MDKHDKYEVVKQAWFEINEHLRNNKQDYIEYLKFSSKMYKQPYSDAVLVFQQDRNATKIAEYKKWGRLGRYVRRGSHGVAVLAKITLADIYMTSLRQAAKSCLRCGHLLTAIQLSYSIRLITDTI